MVDMNMTKMNIWHFKCPYCLSKINYNKCEDSPYVCIYCGEELPEYSSLIDNIDERIDYYNLANVWLFGEEENSA